MAIIFSCPGCGSRMQAPETLAGQKARCPSCQLVVEVPQQVLEAEPAPVYPPPPPPSVPPLPPGVKPQGFSFQDEPEPAEDERRPCPMCGEMIAASAMKCRYCGEIFDPTLRRQAGSPRQIREMHRQMNGVGGLWIFFGTMVLLAIVVFSDKLAQVGDGESVAFVTRVIAIAWLVFGICTCMKQLWAVYAGLVLSYLLLVLNLVDLALTAGKGGGEQRGSPICGLILLVAGIVQAHRVISLAGDMSRS